MIYQVCFLLKMGSSKLDVGNMGCAVKKKYETIIFFFSFPLSFFPLVFGPFPPLFLFFWLIDCHDIALH